MSTTTEAPERKRWLPNRRSDSKKKIDWGLVALMSFIAFICVGVVVFIFFCVRNIERERASTRSSLIANTKDLYGVHVTILSVNKPRASFSIFNGDCIYVDDIVESEGGDWTFVRGAEQLDRAKVTVKSDSASAATCPARPLSDDLDRLADGG